MSSVSDRSYVRLKDLQTSTTPHRLSRSWRLLSLRVVAARLRQLR